MTWPFLKFDMRYRAYGHATGAKHYSDMLHSLFLNSTCDIGEKRRQGHATLPFLIIDMRHLGPPSRAPTGVWIDILWARVDPVVLGRGHGVLVGPQLCVFHELDKVK